MPSQRAIGSTSDARGPEELIMTESCAWRYSARAPTPAEPVALVCANTAPSTGSLRSMHGVSARQKPPSPPSERWASIRSSLRDSAMSP